MSKLFLGTVANILGSPTSAATQINNNSALTIAAVENTLSRDGTSPNQMNTDLDMNHNDILNVASLAVDTLTLGGDIVGTDDTPLLVLNDVITAKNQAVAASVLSQAWAESPTAPGGVGTQSAKSWANSAAAIVAGSVTSVADRTALKALAISISSAYLREAGREGVFKIVTGSIPTSDPNEGVYVLSNTSGYYWKRVLVTDGVYDIKWFGAIADTYASDNYPAIQACINFVQLKAGGTVLISAGGYRIDTGLVISTALVRIEGVGSRHASLKSNSTSINMITIGAARCAVNNLSIFNLVRPTGTPTGLIYLTENATQCTVSDLDLVGGFYCIRAVGITGKQTTNSLVQNVVARLAMGGALVYCLHAGAIIFKDCVFDQDWPVGPPAVSGSNDRGARANSTVYVVGDYYSLGGFLLQCGVAGTSGASAPSLTGIWYGTLIVDGTAQFYIAGNSSGSSTWVDSDCTYITFKDTDMTGAFVVGGKIQNNLGTVAPDIIRYVDCTIAATQLHGIQVDSGRRLYIEGCEMQGPNGNATTIAGVFVNTGFAGDLIVSKNCISQGFDYGVLLTNASAGTVLVEGNDLQGNISAAISVNPGVSNFQLLGNKCGAGVNGASAFGIIVGSGTSNNYIIIGNRCTGVSSTKITDGGSGTNKTVQAAI